MRILEKTLRRYIRALIESNMPLGYIDRKKRKNNFHDSDLDDYEDDVDNSHPQKTSQPHSRLKINQQQPNLPLKK